MLFSEETRGSYTRLITVDCDFYSSPVIYDCKCQVADGSGKRFTTYISKNGEICELYISEKGDIYLENGKAIITLLYDEENAFRSHRVILKNLIREAFVEHNTACKFMKSKTLELV